jgi:sec-independent protein translocase protein TatC
MKQFKELRKCIIRVLVAFILAIGISLGFISRIFEYLEAPLTNAGYKLVVFSPGEIVNVYLYIAGVTGIGLALPFALFQIWCFVKTGLTQRERRYVLCLLPVASLMFLLGTFFAWYVIFPVILRFLLHLSSVQFQVIIHADAYFSFLTNICLPFGFVFELPIVVAFLTNIGAITPTFLRRVRKKAYFFIILLGVLISPPELVSHLSVILPMATLYETSILLSVIITHKRVQRLQTDVPHG